MSSISGHFSSFSHCMHILYWVVTAIFIIYDKKISENEFFLIDCETSKKTSSFILQKRKKI